MSNVHDVRLLASGRRAAFLMADGEVVAVHLPSSRVTAAELEELVARMRDQDFDPEVTE